MIRLATAPEIDFFEHTLYPMQNAILSLLQNDMFYLGGGTCLSRFYYDHRYSEDLDIFFDGYHYSPSLFESSSRELINLISDSFAVDVQVTRDTFTRIIAQNADCPLKIELIYENFKPIGQRQKIGQVWIDSKENMVTNKLTAVYDRKTFKDYVDLYYLMQEYDFNQVAHWASTKMVPLDYEGLLIIFANPVVEGLEGDVLLKKDMSPVVFKAFVDSMLNRMFEYAKSSE